MTPEPERKVKADIEILTMQDYVGKSRFDWIPCTERERQRSAALVNGIEAIVAYRKAVKP